MKNRETGREIIYVMVTLSFLYLVLMRLYNMAADIRSMIGEGAAGGDLWKDLFLLTSVGLVIAGMLTRRYALSVVGAALAFLFEVSLSVPGGVFHYRLLLRGEAVYFGCLACAYLFRRQGALWGGLGVFLKLVFLLYDEVTIHSAIRWNFLLRAVMGQLPYLILCLAVGFMLRDIERESDPDWAAVKEMGKDSPSARVYRNPYPRVQKETEAEPAAPEAEQEGADGRYGGDTRVNEKTQ